MRMARAGAQRIVWALAARPAPFPAKLETQ